MTRYSESSPTDNILQPKYVPSYVKRLDLSCGELFYVFRVPKKGPLLLPQPSTVKHFAPQAVTQALHMRERIRGAFSRT